MSIRDNSCGEIHSSGLGEVSPLQACGKLSHRNKISGGYRDVEEPVAVITCVGKCNQLLSEVEMCEFIIRARRNHNGDK